MRLTFKLFVLLWLLVLAGCGSAPNYSDYPSSGVVYWHGDRASIPSDLSAQIHQTFDRLQRRSGVSARFVLNGTPIANAYALKDAQGPAVYLNAGLIDILGYDLDATAFVLAHELAHLASGHLSEEGRTRIKQQASTAEMIGTVADFFIPLGGLVVEAGNGMLQAGYSRDQEREADREGLKLMLSQGYDPAGAIRFQRKMLLISDPRLAMFATHPAGEERIARLQALIDAYRRNAAPVAPDSRRDSARN